jgi:hypothetical protein
MSGFFVAQSKEHDMAHVDRTALAATTLNTKWWIDVQSGGTYAEPTWVPINGVMEFTPSKETTLQDDSDFDGGGWKSSAATALAWSIEMKLKRAPTVASATAYDTGQEVLRAASDTLGTANRVDVRWYEITASGPVTETYRGYAAVSWSEDGGGMDALSTVTCTLTGQGARSTFAHPDA